SISTARAWAWRARGWGRGSSSPGHGDGGKVAAGAPAAWADNCRPVVLSDVAPASRRQPAGSGVLPAARLRSFLRRRVRLGRFAAGALLGFLLVLLLLLGQLALSLFERIIGLRHGGSPYGGMPSVNSQAPARIVRPVQGPARVSMRARQRAPVVARRLAVRQQTRPAAITGSPRGQARCSYFFLSSMPCIFSHETHASNQPVLVVSFWYMPKPWPPRS